MKPLTIIGGGLAGLTLGIGLRRRGVPVTIWEAGHYPRHRVCGEFISGRGQAILAELGLWSSFQRAGAIPALTAAFFLNGDRSPIRRLPVPALCLSRFKMDALLAEHFQELGGELRDNQQWQGEFGEGIVRASGRRRHTTSAGCRWFGLKVHGAGVPLDADLEMHASSNGYVGLCRLPHGEVNICGLFRHQVAEHAQGGRQMLWGSPNTPLSRKMAHAALDKTSLCSVAGLSFVPQHAAVQPEFCIGDALTLTPPITGNGMSMAFEAAAMAIGRLTGYSECILSWTSARDLFARDCDAAFARRQAWAKFLHWVMFTPGLRGGPALFALHSEWLWRILFAKTR